MKLRRSTEGRCNKRGRNVQSCLKVLEAKSKSKCCSIMKRIWKTSLVFCRISNSTGMSNVPDGWLLEWQVLKCWVEFTFELCLSVYFILRYPVGTYFLFYCIFVVTVLCVVERESSRSTEGHCNKRGRNVADPPYPPLNVQLYFVFFFYFCLISSSSKPSQLTWLELDYINVYNLFKRFRFYYFHFEINIWKIIFFFWFYFVNLKSTVLPNRNIGDSGAPAVTHVSAETPGEAEVNLSFF